MPISNRDKFRQSLLQAETIDKGRFHPWATHVRQGMWGLVDPDGKAFAQSFVITTKETLEAVLERLDELDEAGVLINGVSFATGFVHYGWGDGTAPA